MARNCWLLLLLLLITCFLIQKATSAPIFLANICRNTTTFANNSNYQSNLNTVFRSLSSNATTPTGFSTASAGTAAAVYGLFLCRGDQNASSCRDCVTTATTIDLPQNCANRKVAIIWYDECMVRYSNESFFGEMDQEPSLVGLNSQNITGNLTRYYILGNMMNGITTRAANDHSGKKFATDTASYTSSQTIYGLGQCTPDLTDSDCNTCFRIAIGKLDQVSVGTRVLLPSCNVRYEDYPFFNGAATNQSPPMNSTGMSPSSGEKQRKSHKYVAIAIIIPIVLAVFLLSGTCFCIHSRKGSEALPVLELDEIKSAESLQFDFKAIRAATDNFSINNKLGEGGFGGVYKGRLQNGQEIAVKRLSTNSRQGDKEFKTEVLLVAKLQHKNLVKLLGFCIAGKEKLLVYELLPNSSLDKVLLDRNRSTTLDWETRYKIIAGIARGLLYLHEDSRLKIIHRDLKSSNILLDESMNPKISDFGLAKLVGADEIQADTNRIVGTYGYMAPEYAMTGRFSIKSDVYSFGVIVLEIISGHKCRSTTFPFHEERLNQRAWRLWNQNEALELVDSRLGSDFSQVEVEKCIHISLLCIQEDASQRPTMAPIVSALNGHHVVLAVPTPPQLPRNSGVGSSQLPSKFSGSKDTTEIYPR